MQRLVPELDGLRLQLDVNGEGILLPSEQWSSIAPPQAPTLLMRLLQSNAMAQHGLNLRDVLRGSKIGIEDLEVIYSPFFEALLCFPQIPQLITCHDLTPLSLPTSRRAWLKYRFWQPKHLQCATRVIAISRHVADQLIAFGQPADRISVVPNGIQIQRPALSAPASEDLLVLARHDANKNRQSRLALDKRFARSGIIDAVAGVMRLGDDRIECRAEQRGVHFIGNLFQSPFQNGKGDRVHL